MFNAVPLDDLPDHSIELLSRIRRYAGPMRVSLTAADACAAFELNRAGYVLLRCDRRTGRITAQPMPRLLINGRKRNAHVHR